MADEMQSETRALKMADGKGKILDLCMAPGGYSEKALEFNPSYSLTGLTLPRASGGHESLLQKELRRVEIVYQDLNLLAGQFGLKQQDVPKDHPECNDFHFDKLAALKGPYDLVICDGQVLRTHQRPKYRETYESYRLLCAQLSLALRSLKQGGTLTMLLHKADAWDSSQLLRTMDRISTLRLFKSKRSHAYRSSFYMIAQNVNVESDRAREAVSAWESAWRQATLDTRTTQSLLNRVESEGEEGENVCPEFFEEYGPRLIELSEPIWTTQTEALKTSPFIRDKKRHSSGRGSSSSNWRSSEF